MTDLFSSIDEAITALKAGQMIILMDDEHRENEGDLVIAADHITPEAINFMSRFGRGLICLPMDKSLINKLNLPLMVQSNRSPFGTAFTVSIEAASGVSTGISAYDRAKTVQTAIAKEAKPEDIISPGHIFPLQAHEGGVLKRQGQTEGSVDLVKLAGLTPAAVICEILNEDGSMSRKEDLAVFAKTHDIPMVTIQDLIEYRIRHENLVQALVTTKLPLQNHGEFTLTLFRNTIDDAEHFALIKPPKYTNQVPLIRIHSECITGDIFHSCKCDCGSQLEESLSKIGEEGGVLIYLRQEGRGVGLANKLRAYALQENGYDTVEANLQLGLPADNRSYGVAFQILKYFGIDSARLLTNNPQKISDLEKYGLIVSERIPLMIIPSSKNLNYLKTKKQKLGHLLDIEERVL